MEFGFVEENAGDNRLVITTLEAGQSIHIPQGLMHFAYNNDCEPAQYLASYGTRDPGTQSIWASLMMIPTAALHVSLYREC